MVVVMPPALRLPMVHLLVLAMGLMAALVLVPEVAVLVRHVHGMCSFRRRLRDGHAADDRKACETRGHRAGGEVNLVRVIIRPSRLARSGFVG